LALAASFSIVRGIPLALQSESAPLPGIVESEPLSDIEPSEDDIEWGKLGQCFHVAFAELFTEEERGDAAVFTNGIPTIYGDIYGSDEACDVTTLDLENGPISEVSKEHLLGIFTPPTDEAWAKFLEHADMRPIPEDTVAEESATIRLQNEAVLAKQLTGGAPVERGRVLGRKTVIENNGLNSKLGIRGGGPLSGGPLSGRPLSGVPPRVGPMDVPHAREIRAGIELHAENKKTKPEMIELESENPDDGQAWHSTHIPYCFRAGTSNRAKATVAGAVSVLNRRTNVKFVIVNCGARGHKIEFWEEVNGRPASYTGIYDPVGNTFPRYQANLKIIPRLVGSTMQDINMNVVTYRSAMVYIHELIHALGFGHTQQRSDWRRCYTGVGYDAVTESENCEIMTHARLNGKYDYSSVMSYPDCTNGLNCKRIKVVDHPDPQYCVGNPAKMGKPKKISLGDVVSINDKYPRRKRQRALYK